MKVENVQRLVRVASYIGLALQLATIALWIPAWSGRTPSGTFPMVTATTVMVGTLALQLLFILVPLIPNGRTPVAVGKLGPDGLMWIIVSTMIPGVLWHYLAGLAAPPMRDIMTGFVTPLFLTVLLLISREVQNRRANTADINGIRRD